MSHRINASTIILNCTPLAWPKNFCAVPMIPHNVYYYSPYLFACFTFLLVEKNRFRTACFFFLRPAPWTISLAAVSVISTVSAASATATTSLVWWSTSRRRIRSSSSRSNGSYFSDNVAHIDISLCIFGERHWIENILNEQFGFHPLYAKTHIILQIALQLILVELYKTWCFGHVRLLSALVGSISAALSGPRASPRGLFSRNSGW